MHSMDRAETSYREGRVHNIECEGVRTSERNADNAKAAQSNILPRIPDAKAEQHKVLQAGVSKANARQRDAVQFKAKQSNVHQPNVNQ